MTSKGRFTLLFLLTLDLMPLGARGKLRSETLKKKLGTFIKKRYTLITKIFGENIFGEQMFGGFFIKSPKISVNNFGEKGF